MEDRAAAFSSLGKKLSTGKNRERHMLESMMLQLNEKHRFSTCRLDAERSILSHGCAAAEAPGTESRGDRELAQAAVFSA